MDIFERVRQQKGNIGQYAKQAHGLSLIHILSAGYFIQPTIIQAFKPDYITMREELFGPILTVYVYDPEKVDETLDILDKSSAYALTGAIFYKNRANIEEMTERLTHTAGCLLYTSSQYHLYAP